MVSTRQMATCSNSGSSANVAMNIDENPRSSVVTRQTINMHPASLITETPALSSLLVPAASNASSLAGGCSSIVRQSTSHVATQAINNKPNSSVSSPSEGSPTCSAELNHSPTGSADESNSDSSPTQCIQLLDLPEELLAKIFSYVGYKKIGQLRNVSKKMNEICMRVLNSNFTRLINKTYNRFHSIKSNMPRRESARRNHPLACECDIIETCYMRLSLMQMTFGKHIERGHCCFFPGAILDEVYSILHYIQSTPHLERPYRVTDELFDLSTMAMEYFRDHIEPTLPDIITYFNKDFFKMPMPTPKRPSLSIVKDLSENSPSLATPPQSNMVLRKGIRKIKQGMKIYNNQLSLLRNELRTCKRKAGEQAKQISEQQKLIAEQQKQTLEYANRLDENDKKNEEMARKFSTLLQELNKCKTELQYWRSKSPAIPICTSCGQKVIPMLPPEDYQALINQGVKPEDIVLSLGEDADIEGEGPASESASTTNINAQQQQPQPLILGDNEFAFPNDITTAKLLSINTATKALKKYHNHMQNEEFFRGSAAEGSSASNSHNNSATLNNTSNHRINETAMCSAHVDSGVGGAGNGTSFCTRPFSCIESGEKLSWIESAANSAFYAPSTSNAAAATQHQQHKGVIVSPQSLLAKRKAGDDIGSPLSKIRYREPMDGTPPKAASDDCTAAAAAVQATSPACLSLPTAAAHEINNSNNNNNNIYNNKKARRVQKATRCFSASGKRST